MWLWWPADSLPTYDIKACGRFSAFERAGWTLIKPLDQAGKWFYTGRKAIIRLENGRGRRLATKSSQPCGRLNHEVLFFRTSQMSHHHALFNDKSEIYLNSRPRYPTELYNILANLCENHERVWDAACGNGQAAVDLARYYAEVKATDISEQQIANALIHPKVEYSVQPSESTTFEDGFFDLVCVAQALHWFDHEKFWPEVKRVLRPRGMFAAWGYSWFKIRSDIDHIIEQEFIKIIQPYWAEQNRLLWDHYRNIPFPLKAQKIPDIEMVMSWDIHELFTYLHSWSATRRCMEALGDSFFVNATKKVGRVWGKEHQKRNVVMDFCVIAGRNEI